jgi:acyl carrier protein
MSEHIETITTMLRTIGGIEPIASDADFYDAGFSSVGALQLLLELETTYGVSIPDDDFIAARTPRALGEMVQRLRQGQAA